jgi:hypothetical protein
MHEFNIALDRMMEMAPFGINVERKDRLECGNWVVTCERRIGEDRFNMRDIRAHHHYFAEAVAMAYEIFKDSSPPHSPE